MKTEHLFIGLAVIGAALANLALGALLLRLACGILQEDTPKFLRAVWIVFVSLIVQTGVILLIRLGIRSAMTQMPYSQYRLLELSEPLLILVGCAGATALVYAIMISVSIRRGLLIWFLQTLLSLAITLALYGALYLLSTLATVQPAAEPI